MGLWDQTGPNPSTKNSCDKQKKCGCYNRRLTSIKKNVILPTQVSCLSCQSICASLCWLDNINSRHRGTTISSSITTYLNFSLHQRNTRGSFFMDDLRTSLPNVLHCQSGLLWQRDYRFDLGTAIRKTAESRRLGSQVWLRFAETLAVLLQILWLNLKSQVAQYADTVLCGL